MIDLNRDPEGAALYPGADNTELCPTRTFANEPVYDEGEAPDTREIAARVATFFAPYHAALAAEIARIRARHAYAVLLDGHSIASRIPRFFAGQLPDLNLGTADGTSCAASAHDTAQEVLAGSTGFTHVVNGRFKGGYITRQYGAPAKDVHALQLEIAQCCYIYEAPPWAWDAKRAAPLMQLLERLVIALSEWRPPRR